MAGVAMLGPAGIGDYQTDDVVREVHKEISIIDVKQAPLVALSALAGLSGTEQVYNTKVEWEKINVHPLVVTVASDYTNVATTIVLTSGQSDYVDVNQIIVNSRTNEQMRITAVDPATDTITVTRAFDSSGSAVAGLAGDTLLITTMAVGDKAPVAKGKMRDTIWDFNYTENFHLPVSVSTKAEKTSMYGGSRRNFHLKVKGLEINKQREAARLFGKRYVYSDGGNGIIYLQNGLNNILTTNVHSNGGSALTESIFTSWMVDDMKFTSSGGNMRKSLLASPTMASAIGKWGLSGLRIDPDKTKWGFSPTLWVSPHGEVEIIYHPLLDELLDSSTSFLIDSGDIKNAVFNAMTLKRDTGNPESYQIILDLYYGDECIVVKEERYHAKYYNFTA